MLSPLASAVPVMVPLHATPLDQPPPLTPIRLLTAWTFDIWAVIGLAVPTVLYLYGVWRLHRRGVYWPVTRTLAFCVGGMGTAAIATLSVLGTYDTVLLSIHMVQHMLLSMIVPMFLALGAPVTLALRVLPRRGRTVLTAIVHSRVVKVLSFPPLAFALYISNPFILYFTPIYPVTLESAFWHNWLHVHFVVTSSLFYWPLVGVDPIPNRMSYPIRVLLFFLTMPFHAFLGVIIMSAPTLIAEDWYLSFERAWPPSPLADQEIAGGILWGSGESIASIVIAVLFVQWFRASKREAAREDRRLDRLEAAERRHHERQAALGTAGERHPDGGGDPGAEPDGPHRAEGGTMQPEPSRSSGTSTGS